MEELLELHGVNDVKQTETYWVEPLVPEPNSFEAEIAIFKRKGYELPGIDQISS